MPAALQEDTRGSSSLKRRASFPFGAGRLQANQKQMQRSSLRPPIPMSFVSAVNLKLPVSSRPAADLELFGPKSLCSRSLPCLQPLNAVVPLACPLRVPRSFPKTDGR